MADLRPYPSYKDSGVPWLGEVPEHWEVGTLRRKLRSYDGIKIGPFGSQLKLELMVDVGFKVYGQANVITRDFERGRKFISPAKFNELSACEVLPGDLVVTMMGTSGRCAQVPGDAVQGIMDSHLIRLRTTPDIDRRFAARVIDEAPYIKEQIEIAGKGSIMHGLNSSMIKNLLLSLPTLPEQGAIVRFLDHVDWRIQRYIRSKQKLIKLLEEQKQVVIHEAVTGRIDVRTGKPYPAYKSSGVEWLGDVPEHWDVRRLKSLCTMRSGEGITGQSIDSKGEYPVYGGNGVRGFTSKYTHEGDFVLIGRQGALCGNIHFAHGRFWASEHAVVVSLCYDHNLGWFGAILNEMNLNQYSIAAAQPGLAVERILSLWLPVPPKQEQDLIHEYLQNRTLL